jgi:hypothetical protein
MILLNYISTFKVLIRDLKTGIFQLHKLTFKIHTYLEHKAAYVQILCSEVQGVPIIRAVHTSPCTYNSTFFHEMGTKIPCTSMDHIHGPYTFLQKWFQSVKTVYIFTHSHSLRVYL